MAMATPSARAARAPPLVPASNRSTVGLVLAGVAVMALWPLISVHMFDFGPEGSPSQSQFVQNRLNYRHILSSGDSQDVRVSASPVPAPDGVEDTPNLRAGGVPPTLADSADAFARLVAEFKTAHPELVSGGAAA